MPFAAFHQTFPELAKTETRSISITPTARLGVPPGDYAFIELYCDEPGCDCRRVMFEVFSLTLRQTVAIIAWGWEDLAFYARWYGSNDPFVLSELKGPALNFGSPQSPYAEPFLELTRNVLLCDSAYVERIKRHYAMFRARIEQHARKRKKKRRKK
jgi:hypothetical protein